MPAKIDSDSCIACAACGDVCPSDAIVIKADFAMVKIEDCMDCGICVDECPEDAITIE